MFVIKNELHAPAELDESSLAIQTKQLKSIIA